jgi:hypothetical protein
MRRLRTILSKSSDTSITRRKKVKERTLPERQHHAPDFGGGNLSNVCRPIVHTDALAKTHEDATSDEADDFRRKGLEHNRDEDDKGAELDGDPAAISLRDGGRNEKTRGDGADMVGWIRVSD